MAFVKNEKKQSVGEIVHLGRVLHPCGDLMVIRIEHRDIPYPGAPVFLKNRQIGRVEEVFGKLDGAYAAIKAQGDGAFSGLKPDEKVGGCKSKFILRGRFLSRDQVEKVKTQRKKEKVPPKFKKGSKFNMKRGRR